MKLRQMIAALAALGALSVPVAALAHAKVIAATPAANATVAPTRTVRLAFSERIMPRLSSATLTMTSSPGMANHVMKMTGVTSAVSEDGKSITLTGAMPLSAGSYRVDWVIVGVDTHRITGTHAFSVR
jgi:methionine-rich copper-binding protein CopC